MTPMLPFVAVPLAVAYRRLPLTTLVLAAISLVEMVAITLHATALVIGLPRLVRPLRRIGDFSQTAIGLAGGSSRHGIYLFLVAATFAAALAVLATPRPLFSRRDAVLGGVLVAGWALVERRGSEFLDSNLLGDGNGAVVALLVGAAIALVAVVIPRLLVPDSPSAGRDSAGRR